MLKNGNGVQMWVQPNTREAYKQIGQSTGESQADVAARLAQQEQKRLERRQAKLQQARDADTSGRLKQHYEGFNAGEAYKATQELK